MHINSKVRYGLRTMIEIAIEVNNGIYQKDIAERQDLPNKYLDHIIAALKAENLIHKANDSRKGYVLSRTAAEISIYDIYSAFEPDLQVAPCHTKNEKCERIHFCSSFNFWSGLNEKIRDYLDNTLLSDLTKIQIDINESLNRFKTKQN